MRAAAVLRHMEWYRGLGSPRLCVAPMVDGSELAFRLACREFGAQLTWTPMLHARMTVETGGTYLSSHFTTSPSDRPLIAQFAGDNADTLIAAARYVEDRVDAIDINLGCPQGIARRGHYGAFLLDEPDLVVAIVTRLTKELKVPVTCKIRVLPTLEATLSLARRLEAAGCALLTVHGRTRTNMKQAITATDWAAIAAVKAAVGIPVIANGSIACAEDVRACLAATGVDGVMVSEAILENPGLFSDSIPTGGPLREALDAWAATTKALPATLPGHAAWPEDIPRVNSIGMAKRYCEISAAHRSTIGIVKSHVIKMLFGVFRAPEVQRAILRGLDEAVRQSDKDWSGALAALAVVLDDVQRSYDAHMLGLGRVPGVAGLPGFTLRTSYTSEVEARRQVLLAEWAASGSSPEPSAPSIPCPAWSRPEYLVDPVIAGGWYMRHRPDAYPDGGSKQAPLAIVWTGPQPAAPAVLATPSTTPAPASLTWGDSTFLPSPTSIPVDRVPRGPALKRKLES
jgi:tRNA-dihydrouridine synthase